MKDVYIISKVVARKGEAIASPSKGAQKIDFSDYLLKSMWDKVFELKTDSQGIDYIFSKLPVVTQYGITMYSGDGVDIPSLASGLPFDGRTIWYNPDTNQIEVIGGTGGGSGEGVSNFWDLSGIPSWITISKPKYSYSEIEGTPDLSGFATQNWIISQGYASAEELKKYIPISGYTEVSGEKNFTGGLKVNGSPIYYDTEKKYWKLEGDLLVTGGVTMYGVDSTDIPSLIKSLPVASTKEKGVAYFDPDFFSVSSDGKVSFIGETGGGLDIVSLQNYLTQNSYLNVAEGDNRYLKLSGGELSGTTAYTLTIKRTGNVPLIAFNQEGDLCGFLGVSNNSSPLFYDNHGEMSYILHSGNYSSYALPLSGGTMNGDITLTKNSGKTTTYSIDFFDGTHKYLFAEGGVLKYGANPNINTIIHSGNVSSYNAGSATKLKTERTIWGRSFDGTGNVSGNLFLDAASSVLSYNSDKSASYELLRMNAYYSLVIGLGCSNAAGDLFLNGNSIYLRYGTSNIDGVIINSSGNVGIGTTRPTLKLDIVGSMSLTGEYKIGGYDVLRCYNNALEVGRETSFYQSYSTNIWGNGINFYNKEGNLLLAVTNGGNFGFGVATPTSKLHVSGDILATGGITTNDSVTINGIKLSKSKDGVLYLDGNLVVKGGVTMYGTDATSSPSILNSLPIASTKEKGVAYFDSEFFSVGSDGKVTFIGKTDGFNVTELQNYLTQNSYLNTTSGDNRYLKLSGGELSGTTAYTLTIKRTGNVPLIAFNQEGDLCGFLGVSNNSSPLFYDNHGEMSYILHSGNYSSYALPLSGGTMNGDITLTKNSGKSTSYAIHFYDGTHKYLFTEGGVLKYGASTNPNTIIHSGNVGSYNAGSATKLQTARTIWGNSFDGTGNISGILYLGQSAICGRDNAIVIDTTGEWSLMGFGTAAKGWPTYLDGNDIYLRYGVSHAHGMILNSLGNVGIGTTSPSHKLHVVGNTYLNGDVFADDLNTYDVIPRSNNFFSCGNSGSRWYQVYSNIGDFSGAVNMGSTLNVTGMTTMTNATITGYLRLKDTTNYGRAIYFGDGEFCYLEEASDDVMTIYASNGIKLNTSSTSYNVSINTNLLVSGGITMYSQRSLKNIQDERGLSLGELGAIKPIRYTWKDNRDNRLHIGGIADDIQQVLPEVVYKTNDGVLTMDYGNAAFAIASSLIKPVVDHEKRIAMLEEENKELRNEIERLKSA